MFLEVICLTPREVNQMERVVERVGALIPAQPKALRVCAYARVSTGKDAMLHSVITVK